MHGEDCDEPTSQQTAAPTSRTIAREAFFLNAARSIRNRFPNILLLVTGGFRSRASMEEALQNGACNFIGIARPAAITPKLPSKVILNEKIEADGARFRVASAPVPRLLNMLPMSRIIGGSAESVRLFLGYFPLFLRPCYIDAKFLFCFLDYGANGNWQKYFREQIRRIGNGLPPIAPPLAS